MSLAGHPPLPTYDLQPGELYLARGPAVLRTILGSCVGVTFWCRRLEAGALCHGVLPHRPEGGSSHEKASRYVDYSIQHLLREFRSLGARREELELKVFGGADVLPSAARLHHATVGAQNIAAAGEVLAREGFSPAATDVGGTRGRRIQFHTGIGEVLVHRLPSWAPPHAAKRHRVSEVPHERS